MSQNRNRVKIAGFRKVETSNGHGRSIEANKARVRNYLDAVAGATTKVSGVLGLVVLGIVGVVLAAWPPARAFRATAVIS